jgi:hypothetical protein
MAPFVRRTWAPRGQTPVLWQRTRHHQKVSVIAALTVSPSRDDVGLYFRLHLNRNLGAQEVADFLKILHRQLGGSVLIVWDRLQTHRAKKVHGLVAATPGLHVEFFPPYAPELNPVEYVWSYLKTNPLANLGLWAVADLAHEARRQARILQHDKPLLRSVLNHCPLSLKLR